MSICPPEGLVALSRVTFATLDSQGNLLKVSPLAARACCARQAPDVSRPARVIFGPGERLLTLNGQRPKGLAKNNRSATSAPANGCGQMELVFAAISKTTAGIGTSSIAGLFPDTMGQT